MVIAATPKCCSGCAAAHEFDATKMDIEAVGAIGVCVTTTFIGTFDPHQPLGALPGATTRSMGDEL